MEYWSTKKYFLKISQIANQVSKYAQKKKMNDLIMTPEEDDKHINDRLIKVALILPMIFVENHDYICLMYPVEATLNYLQ